MDRCQASQGYTRTLPGTCPWIRRGAPETLSCAATPLRTETFGRLVALTIILWINLWYWLCSGNICGSLQESRVKRTLTRPPDPRSNPKLPQICFLYQCFETWNLTWGSHLLFGSLDSVIEITILESFLLRYPLGARGTDLKYSICWSRELIFSTLFFILVELSRKNVVTDNAIWRPWKFYKNCADFNIFLGRCMRRVYVLAGIRLEHQLKVMMKAWTSKLVVFKSHGINKIDILKLLSNTWGRIYSN